ncbi:MAG: transglutaminase family protein [Promethearchaeota archaeon]
MNSFDKYLQPTYFIDFQSPTVHDLAENLQKGDYHQTELVKKIFEHVRDTIKYSIEIFRQDFQASDFKASTTIKKGKGFCIPKSIALVALLRAASIPARLHFADIINHRSLPHI